MTGGFRHDASEGLRRLKKFTGLYTGPYFDQIGNPANVTAQLGETAILPCRVKQIGQRTVRTDIAGWLLIGVHHCILYSVDGHESTD